MNRYLQSAVIAALGVASMTCALAQEIPSTPNQRDPSSTTQAPPATGAEPSTATPSPQRQAAAGTSKETQKQMMKDCVAKEQANNTGVSASQAKKTCKAEMKSNSSSPKNY